MASALLISLGCVHRKLEHAFEEVGDGQAVKPPSWHSVALEYTDGY